MTVTLLDTGPIVALLNRRDRYHQWVVKTLATVRPPLLTCEAVLSEAVFLLGGVSGAPPKVLELIERQMVVPTFRLESEIAAVRALLTRYQDARMDLADACLVRLSELHADSVLMTVDSEFRDLYRRQGRQIIPTLLPPTGPQRLPKRTQ